MAPAETDPTPVSPRESLETPPAFRNEKEMRSWFQERMPERADKILEALEQSIRDQEAKVKLENELHLAGFNGRAPEVARHLMLCLQELRRKEGWFSWALRRGKESVQYVWKKSFVEHPYLSTAAVAGIALILALKFTPLGGMAQEYLTTKARQLVNYLYPGLEKAQEIAQAAGEKAGEAIEKGKDALGKLKDAAGGVSGGDAGVPPIPNGPSLPPVDTRLPTDLPPLE